MQDETLPGAPEGAPAHDDLDAALNAAISSQTQPAEPEAQAESAAPEKEPEAAAERDDGRDERGRFAAKPKADDPAAAQEPAAADAEQPAPEAAQVETAAVRPPPGFSPASKADWEKLPAHVRADIAKREQEMDAGMRRYTGLGQYADIAERNGTTLGNAVADYWRLESGLRQDFLGGIEAICQRFGVDPRSLNTALSSRYGGAPMHPGQDDRQAPQQPAFDPNAIVQQAKREVRAEYEQRENQSMIAQFAADPKNKFFENVRGEMAALIQSGRVTNLADAYDMACWARPDIRPFMTSAQDAGAVQVQQRAAAANQARLAAKAVTGAPTSGINPGAARATNLSIDDAVEAAIAAQAGRA